MVHMVKERDAIGYVRVSTAEQGRSGLGLEAQEAAIRALCAERGLKLRALYSETRSGADKTRTELPKALAHARRAGCVVVVKDLSRLSRRMSEALRIVEDYQTLLADSPTATVLEVRVRALLAAQEREEVSRRTKAALAAAKARGTLLGSARPNHWAGRERQRQRGLTKAQGVAAKLAADRRGDCYQLVRDLRDRHPTASIRQLARLATAENIMLPRGGSVWSPVQVRRALAATT